MDTVEITGKTYIAGYAGYAESPVLRQLEAKNLKIQGTENYVAGIIGYLHKRIGYNAWYVTVSDSEVQGQDYVGGIFAWSSAGGNNPSPRYVSNFNSY